MLQELGCAEDYGDYIQQRYKNMATRSTQIEIDFRRHLSQAPPKRRPNNDCCSTQNTDASVIQSLISCVLLVSLLKRGECFELSLLTRFM